MLKRYQEHLREEISSLTLFLRVSVAVVTRAGDQLSSAQPRSVLSIREHASLGEVKSATAVMT
jgi:hypothetical protein